MAIALSGTTLPLDPRTLPKRTVTSRVDVCSDNAWTYISARRLQAPMTQAGLTALSVEIITNASTPLSMASSTRVLVPKTLFLTASPGLASIIGTCLCAAA